MKGLSIATLCLLMPFSIAQDNWNEKTFAGLSWRSLGPALMSGRIADIAIHPNRASTWYVAAGSGGVWKTENSGTTWQPIFDRQGSYSIGCLTIDKQQPSTIWVGTGENVSGRHVGFGDGVYRSQDGGTTWTHMGLRDSQHIGMIKIDPRDSRVVYVAAQGPLWSAGGERGLYRTDDGGATWKKVLGDGDYVGCNEVHLDPDNPDVIYASMHQRFRNVAALVNGGPGSGIYKSVDGGDNWSKLTKGLPEEDMGKIGLAISPFKSNVLYAAIELGARKGAFYRSTDAGASWEKRSDTVSGGTGPHYYQEIFASPHVMDRVYLMDVWIQITDDGGSTFKRLGEKNKHSDNHAMAFRPDDADYLLVGCDGGLYESFDHAKSWRFFSNLPLTQFYKVAVDDDLPFYNLYGGTQDNNTQGGPSQTDNNSGIRNSDWFVTLFGDGHQPAVDPTNPDIVYSEWQQGNLVRFDRMNGEITYIRPQPKESDPAERWNWDAPILVSPHNPARLYYASHRVWRSDDRGDSWQPISGDLSRGQNRLQMPIMGQTWGVDAAWDLYAMSFYGSVTSLSESPIVEGLLYAGTDDGLIQVSDDNGGNWRSVEVKSLPGVPKMAFVNDIKADLHDADTVYVALDNHKNGDFRPMLARSKDRGRKWQSLADGLPERHLVWRLVQDHVDEDLLFVGTEFGVFCSTSGGTNWVKLEGGLPNIPVRDLAIQRRENDLVAATFGRGFYVLDDYSALRALAPDQLAEPATLFGVADAYWYVPQRPLAMQPKAYQGDAFFTAENPPFGAVFTYFLREDTVSRRKRRQADEQTRRKAGEPVRVGAWEDLHQEEREDEPAIILTVTDSRGQVVRQLSGPTTAGFHRVAWDLRYPKLDAWKPKGDEPDYFLGDQGWLAAPGSYRVSLAKRVDGVLTSLAPEQTFDVVPLPGLEHHLPAMDPDEVTAFYAQIAAMQGTSTALTERFKETRTRILAIKESLLNSKAAPEFRLRAHQLEARLYHMEDTLSGDRMLNRMGEPTKPSIQDRIFAVSLGNLFSTKGPSPNHLESYQVAKRGLEELVNQLNQLVQRDLVALESDLDAAGVPWTPGRPVLAPK